MTRPQSPSASTTHRGRAAAAAGALLVVLGAIVPDPLWAADDRDRALRLVVKGLESLREGRLDSAQTRFEKAVSADAANAEAYDGLGRVALKRGLYEDALEYLLTARELYQLAAASRMQEEIEQVARLQQTQQAYRDIAGEMGQAGCLVETSLRRRIHGGNRDLEGRAPTGPLSLQALPAGLCFRTGVCLLHLGRPDLAQSEFHNELAINPGSMAARVNLAVCELTLGNPTDALSALDDAVRLGAREPDGLRAEILDLLEAQRRADDDAPASLPSEEP